VSVFESPIELELGSWWWKWTAGAHRNSRAADRRRDERLERLGCRVVRVDAAVVSRSIKAAVALLHVALSK
jgi:very-short-patch-repair endonuclease